MLIKKRVRSANLRIRFFLVSMSCFIENCAFKKYSDTFQWQKRNGKRFEHRPAEWPGTQKVWPVQVGLLHKLQFQQWNRINLSIWLLKPKSVSAEHSICGYAFSFSYSNFTWTRINIPVRYLKNKKPDALHLVFIWLGWKDLNPRNNGVRVRCLTTWRHPNIWFCPLSFSDLFIISHFFVFVKSFFQISQKNFSELLSDCFASYSWRLI